MTLVEPLHNLTAVPPISYLLPKLMNSYTRRLGGMNPQAMVHSVLVHDQCQYWPEYVTTHTNLTRASSGIAVITYRPVDPCKTGLWTSPCLTHIPNATNHTIKAHKASLRNPSPSDLHVVIHPSSRDNTPVALYFISRSSQSIHRNVVRGEDQTQAICQAVKAALAYIIMHTHQAGHLIIWVWPKTIPVKILTLTPHRDTHLTHNSRGLIDSYLQRLDSNTVDFRTVGKSWPGTPTQSDIWEMEPEIATLLA